MDNTKTTHSAFKIALVDDNSINLELLETHMRMLENQVGIAIDTISFENGNDLMHYLEEHTLDLILLDRMMPELSGDEVCEMLKNDADYQHIPVIFVTSLYSDEHKSEGKRLGAEGYLTKPYIHTDIVNMLTPIIERATGR